MLDIRYTENYTFAELAQALAALEFTESKGITDLGAAYRAFYNKTHDALIVLPDMPDADTLAPLHLRRAERTVEDRGVTESATLFRLLREVGMKAA